MEDPLAAVQVPEEAAEAPPPRRRLGGRDARDGAGQEGRDAQGRREVEGRDAHRGGDAAQGQIHHLRPEGEEVPEGHTQYVCARPYAAPLVAVVVAVDEEEEFTVVWRFAVC